MENIIINLAYDDGNLPVIVTDLIATNRELAAENKFLREQLGLLRARKFGKSSEKLPSQLEIEEFKAEEEEQTISKPEESNKDEPKQDKARRQKLPQHLPREEVILMPDAVCPSCKETKFRKIGEDVSEVLEYVPASFKVKRFIRPRCACVACEQIVQAYAPSNPIDKGKAVPSLLAHILIQKYCNHLPLYRQSEMYAREGVEISRSTMAGWVGQCAKLLKPLIEGIKEYVLNANELHGDDTPIKVLAPGLGQTKTGRLWRYVRDGRPYGCNMPPAVCYFYSADRKGERPLEHLKGYQGVLHADAYAGYNGLFKDKDGVERGITEAMCWAHVRRKFYEVTVVNDKANIAFKVLDEIGKIYEIEAGIRGSDPGDRLKERQEKSKPLVKKLFTDFKKYYEQLPRKSGTARAIAYALNNKIALERFLEDGKIEIDNNAAERALRSVAVGRKNWLFAGSDAGGESAAAMYTLIETAKFNGLNPWLYLQSVLKVIQDYNSTKLADLLPWNFKLSLN